MILKDHRDVSTDFSATGLPDLTEFECPDMQNDTPGKQLRHFSLSKFAPAQCIYLFISYT